MPHYVVSVRSPLAPREAFAYMADVRNFAEWDPGVKGVEQVVGEGAGPNTAFDVTVNGVIGDLTLRYKTVEYEPSRTFVVRASSTALTSVDTVTVEPYVSGGSVVTYDAELALKGLFKFGDPLLNSGFNRIGDKAAKGLVEALGGERIRSTADRSALANLADSLIEAPIVPSFTKVGYQARKRLDDWTPLDGYDLTGRVIVVTGASSGLGKAAARQLALCGATLVLVGRTPDRNQGVVDDLVAETGNEAISQFATDMGDYGQVRKLATYVLEAHDRLDVLLHNAGALSDTRHVAADGTEATIASQVIGPFLLTELLLDRLSESAPSRVITMSSGGMYTAPLTVGGLEMSEAKYRGAEQYARAKRAQVTLSEMWAERCADRGVVFHSVHPGWADTPGVEESLPGFRRVMGPLLRDPLEGADTMIWLAADDEALASTGNFWLDRRTRSIHKLPTTRKTDTADRRERLWSYVEAKLA